eukprot:418260-Prorocentrum_minimum.AAC.3
MITDCLGGTSWDTHTKPAGPSPNKVSQHPGKTVRSPSFQFDRLGPCPSYPIRSFSTKTLKEAPTRVANPYTRRVPKSRAWKYWATAAPDWRCKGVRGVVSAVPACRLYALDSAHVALSPNARTSLLNTFLAWASFPPPPRPASPTQYPSQPQPSAHPPPTADAVVLRAVVGE